MPTDGNCVICGKLSSDSHKLPIRSGCGCPGSAIAHVGCRAKCAERAPHLWWQCQMCGLRFTGAMDIALARERWSRVNASQPDSHAERLVAARNLADCLCRQGRHSEAALIRGDVVSARRRVMVTDSVQVFGLYPHVRACRTLGCGNGAAD